MNSASLCSLAGRYDNPIPTRCLAHIDVLKIPALLLETMLQRNSPSHHRPVSQLVPVPKFNDDICRGLFHFISPFFNTYSTPQCVISHLQEQNRVFSLSAFLLTIPGSSVYIFLSFSKKYRVQFIMYLINFCGRFYTKRYLLRKHFLSGGSERQIYSKYRG